MQRKIMGSVYRLLLGYTVLQGEQKKWLLAFSTMMNQAKEGNDY